MSLLDATGKPFQQNDEKTWGIYAPSFRHRTGACEYYRIDLPLRGLKEHRPVEYWIDRGEHPDLGRKLMLHADFVLNYNLAESLWGGMIEAIRDMKPAMNDGKFMIPPTLVFDVDDNNEFTHPFNTSYCSYGVRVWPNGKLLEPGDNVTFQWPDGKRATLWEDKVTQTADGNTFDIARNRKWIDSQHATARLSHGVTVSSLALKKFYEDVLDCKYVYFFPNTMVEEDYTFVNLAPRTDGSIRVLWQGGDSHIGDWFQLGEALTIIAAKYPQVKFVIWGAKFPYITDAMPREQLEFHPWVDYGGYKIKRHILDCDINLAPLFPNVFNRCKSGIKWYEASLGPHPEVTLAQRTQPYSLEMTDGVDGLLFSTPEEFIEKLSVLIENAELRRTLAENARTWVRQNRSMKATIPGLAQFYEELRSRRGQEIFAS
jgi:glycosyltransferase involved in cell wall biosynthesis